MWTDTLHCKRTVRRATATPVETPRTPLDRLPTELRLQTYYYILQPRELHVQHHFTEVYHGPPSLFLVSKVSYADARDYFLNYATHTIYIAGWAATSLRSAKLKSLMQATKYLEAVRSMVTSIRQLRLSIYLGGVLKNEVMTFLRAIMTWVEGLLTLRTTPLPVFELCGCGFQHNTDTSLSKEKVTFTRSLL